MKTFLILSIVSGFFICGTYSKNENIVQKRLSETTVAFFQTFQPGICAQMILNETIRSQYLSDTLIGRVQPVGTFPITELALEYLYGLLCSIPNLPPRREVANAVNLFKLTYSSNSYLVSFKIRIDMVSGKKANFYGMLAFDKKFKLCGYEAVIQNLGLTFDFSPATHPAWIQGLCQGTQVVCPAGSLLEQYASVSACISALTAPNKPFGSYDRGDQDNVICRLIHLQLAQIAPSIHCPHLGPTGGGACTDKSAASYFEGTTDFVQCAYQYEDM